MIFPYAGQFYRLYPFKNSACYIWNRQPFVVTLHHHPFSIKIKKKHFFLNAPQKAFLISWFKCNPSI